MDARKERLDEAAAWALLKDAERITVAKGKNFAELDPQHVSRADILKQVMGPSGNLRAPALAMGNEFIIGFNEVLYGKIFRGS